MQFTAQQRSALLDLARNMIRGALGQAAAQGGNADDPALHQPAGCFVSLHTLDTHALRGCVGRLDASMPLNDAVRKAAADVLHDPRFEDYPVIWVELPALELEISVLSPLRPIDHPLDFDLKDGICLRHEQRAGCFLPQVAQETGWSREQLLNRLCSEKLGIDPGAWRDREVKAFTFTTCIIGPEPFEK